MKKAIKDLFASIGVIAVASALIIFGFRKKAIDLYDLNGVIAE